MGFLDFLFGTGKKLPPQEESAFSVEALASLVREGHMIPAIKMVRLHSQAGLKEAKEFVDFMAQQGMSWDKTAEKFPLIASALSRGKESPFLHTPAKAGSASPAFSPWENLAPHLQESFSSHDRREIEALIHGGRKIEAIKLVREKTNLGLKESKDFVDSFEAHY